MRTLLSALCCAYACVAASQASAGFSIVLDDSLIDSLNGPCSGVTPLDTTVGHKDRSVSGTCVYRGTLSATRCPSVLPMVHVLFTGTACLDGQIDFTQNYASFTASADLQVRLCLMAVGGRVAALEPSVDIDEVRLHRVTAEAYPNASNGAVILVSEMQRVLETLVDQNPVIITSLVQNVAEERAEQTARTMVDSWAEEANAWLVNSLKSLQDDGAQLDFSSGKDGVVIKGRAESTLAVRFTSKEKKLRKDELQVIHQPGSRTVECRLSSGAIAGLVKAVKPETEFSGGTVDSGELLLSFGTDKHICLTVGESDVGKVVFDRITSTPESFIKDGVGNRAATELGALRFGNTVRGTLGVAGREQEKAMWVEFLGKFLHSEFMSLTDVTAEPGILSLTFELSGSPKKSS